MYITCLHHTFRLGDLSEKATDAECLLQAEGGSLAREVALLGLVLAVVVKREP